MSRVDITATAAMAQWQERIEKERAHAQTRRDFTTNPKTMYVITEKPQHSGWSREFQTRRAEEQALLFATATAAAGPAGAGAAQSAYSPLTPSIAAGGLGGGAYGAKAIKAKGGGAAPVHTAVAITSPLTHTTTVVGAGVTSSVTPPATPPVAKSSAAAAAKAKSPTKTLSSAGAFIASPSPAKPKSAAAPEETKGLSATGSATATASASATGSAALAATWKHMRAAPVRRDHPLATSDPALATTLRRSDLGPTEKWEWPQTNNHEYGWNAAPVMPADRATHLWWKGLKSSDISEYVSNYVTTQGGKTPFSTKTSADRPLVQSHD